MYLRFLHTLVRTPACMMTTGPSDIPGAEHDDTREGGMPFPLSGNVVKFTVYMCACLRVYMCVRACTIVPHFPFPYKTALRKMLDFSTAK